MSIRQNPEATRLPDFCNMGVMLRAMLSVNLLAFFAAAARSGGVARLPDELLDLAALVEPPLIAGLILLCGLRRWLARLDYRYGAALVVALASAVAIFFAPLFDPLGHAAFRPSHLVAGAWGAAAALAVLSYLDLRSRAFSPALAEARLLALTARIRPHFLFNCLNGVLGVIRSDPRRAERALEELADLFRVLMAENRALVTLGEEIALCRQYLELEHLRLGERLSVRWDAADGPADALVPPLMLQPLVENAVYHGVEPSAGPAEIVLGVRREGDVVHVEISNPFHGERDHHNGNRMALENIRERLMLFYDLEARMETQVRDGVYRVRIQVPYRKGKAP